MVVMILENVPIALRGELSRWMLELRAGVFIGHINTLVRDLLWQMCCNACQEGGIIQAWSTNTEQHFEVRVFGDTRREIINLEGVFLVRRQ